jgi:hypothetical protein
MVPMDVCDTDDHAEMDHVDSHGLGYGPEDGNEQNRYGDPLHEGPEISR